MSSIAASLQALHGEIESTCARHERAPGSVALLAVSKRQPLAALREAYACGQREFGENYVQEALEKRQQLRDLDISWHFIGPIQTNKTRDIASGFDWVHSVDRPRVAERLSAQRDPALPPLNVCVQVKLSAEETKSGVALADVEALCALVDALPRLCLRGLMAIPAPLATFPEQRACFAPLRAEFLRLQSAFPSLDTLSIGMSGDFEAAIAEGSTVVRIGTALFGARPD